MRVKSCETCQRNVKSKPCKSRRRRRCCIVAYAEGTVEMERLKTFLKKRALLMGTLAVAIPLVFIIFWQYRSLRSLEKTLPVYRKEVMRDYLRAVVKEVHTFYYDNAMDALSVPAEAITNRAGG